MPIAQQLLLNIPTVLLGLIIVGGSVLLATATIFVVHYLVPRYKAKEQSGVTAILLASKTLIYSILLSLVLFSAWFGFNDASIHVQKEASCIVELYRSTETFLPAIKQEVRELLEEYAKSIVNEEWKTLSRSELNPRTTEIAKKLWKILASYEPKTQLDQVFLQESIRKLSELRECRAMRLSDSETGVYPLLWILLIAGEMATVASIAFFAEDVKAKVTMAILYAFLIGLIFFAILLFDFPYTGDFSVSSKPIKEIATYW
jgi:hypothetical protein